MIKVFTLVHSRAFESAIVCLRSFVRYNHDDVKLVICSDGSLNKNQCTQLRDEFGEVRDSNFLQGFCVDAKYPQIQKHLKRYPIFHKAVSLPLRHFEQDPDCGKFAFLDSDILFFRHHKGLFLKSAGYNSFSEDIAVTIGMRDLWKWKSPVHFWINSGIIHSGLPDYDRIENFLQTSRDTIGKIYEQFAWIISHPEKLVQCITSNQVIIENRWRSLRGTDIGAGTVALHLTSHRKYLYPQYLQLLETVDINHSKVVQIQRADKTAVSPRKALLIKIMRRMARYA